MFPGILDFLRNGQNNTRTIEIIEDELVKEKRKIQEKLNCNEIYFSMAKVCNLITVDSVNIVEELSSNQEEADTKLLLYTNHSLQHSPELQVVARSHSGDTDINVLFMSKFIDTGKIILDFGTTTCRKVINIGLVRMSNGLKEVLIGFHGFTGNDCVSSIFKKTKDACWQKVIHNHKFIQVFQQLGNMYKLEEGMIQLLEECTCALYGKNQKDVNLVRYELFKEVYERKNKIQDLSLRPPCKQSLLNHCKWANFVAAQWKSCLEGDVEYHNVANHEWTKRP